MATELPSQGSSSLSKSGAANSPLRFDRLKATLSPFRAVALGLAEGVQSVSEQSIRDIKQRHFGYVNLERFCDELEDVQYYEMVMASDSLVGDCKGAVDEKLWRAAIMQQMCQKVVYCLLDRVRVALEDKLPLAGPFLLASEYYSGTVEQDAPTVAWKRSYIKPALILFRSTRDQLHEINIHVHDYVRIRYRDKQSFVLDVTNDQFGLDEWFYKAKNYNELLWDVRNFHIQPQNEVQLAAELEEQEPRLPGLKSAVEKVLGDEEAAWATRQLNWDNLYQLSEDELNEILNSMEERVKQAVVVYLTSDITKMSDAI